MKVTVSVTQRDIYAGEAGEPCQCPVARAIERVLPDSDPWVNTGDVRFYGTPGIFEFIASVPLPSEARDFIGRYDNAVSVEPFEFELELPDDVLAGAS